MTENVVTFHLLSVLKITLDLGEEMEFFPSFDTEGLASSKFLWGTISSSNQHTNGFHGLWSPF